MNGLEALEFLDCSDNKPLTTLLLSENKFLNYLKCDNTAIETLDLRKLEQLEVLMCGKNSSVSTQNLPLLSTLHLPESKRLKSLSCWNTDVKTIELNGFQFLEVIEFYTISQNSYQSKTLERLDITNSPVKRILCYGHNIQSLNINNLPNLELMVIRSSDFQKKDNQVIDISQSSNLQTIALENITCNLNVNTCTALETLNILGAYTQVSSLNNNTALKEIVIFLQPDETFDFSSHTLLEKLNVRGGSYININNCKRLIELSIQSAYMKTILLQQATDLQNVYIYCNNLASLNLSGCENLESLWIYSDSSEELDIDISDCRNLQSFTLIVENLYKLNASGCKKLVNFKYKNEGNYFGPIYRNLTILNMSNCTSLQTLTCSYNKLTSLDVSGCTALTRLECNNNDLVSLDVSSCFNLNYLYCYDNNDLNTLTMNMNQHFTTLSKDDHTQIVLKD